MNTTQTNRVRPGRLTTGFITGAAGVLVGVLATLTLVDQSNAAVQPITPAASVSSSTRVNADTPERQQASPGYVGYPCRPDAASRWQQPSVRVAELPYSADTAEHWVTPEFGVADLPYSADTAERLLCAP